MDNNLKQTIGDDPLYDKMQAFLAKHPGLSEGEIARAGIRMWLEEAAKHDGETYEYFEYYSTRTSAVRAEEKAWSEIAAYPGNPIFRNSDQ